VTRIEYATARARRRFFFVLADSHPIAFSRHAIAYDRVLALHGDRLSLPPERELCPGPEYLEWHREEVFKDPPRSFS
jgi:hypothetical protein